MEEKLINVFAKEIMEHNYPFSIELGNVGRKTHYHFIQDNVGTGRYIYGDSDYGDELFYAGTELKYKLVAIVVEEIIYIVDSFFFDIWYDYENKQIPKNCHLLTETVKKMNEHIQKNVFTDFYAGLSTQGVEPYSNCEQEARLCLLKGTVPTAESDIEFDLGDAARCLCHITSLEEEALRRLNKKREQWQKVKATNEKIVGLMKKGNVIKPYELELAKALELLQSLDAKTVNVEFEVNGLRATTKMTPERIVYILTIKENISEWDFVTRKSGIDIIKYLGLGKNDLRCEHITKITYGKTTFFERDFQKGGN
jgi:hypothetical protein